MGSYISARNKGVGCSYCSNQKVLIGFNDLNTTNPQLVCEWNYIKNNNITPQDITKGSSSSVWWLCAKEHSWKASVVNRIRHNQGCPICCGKQVLQGYNDLATNYPQILDEGDYIKNTTKPSEYTKNSSKKVWWICKEKHSWLASIHNRTRNRGCHYCSGSKTERLLYDLLKEKGISFKAEKKFDSTPKYEVQYYPYDIYINNHRLINETDGIQHFEDIPFFSNVSFETRVRRDNVKNAFCFDLPTPIPILRIPYTYNPDTEKDKIEKLVMDFIETRQVLQEILDFYKPYKESIVSNYYDIANKMNEIENKKFLII